MRTLILLLAIAILNSTCKKPSDPPPPPHKNTLTASVNGVSFVATNINVDIGAATVPSAKTVYINVRHIENLIGFKIYDYDGQKSIFKLDITSDTWATYSPENCSYILCPISESNSGELKIDSFEKTTNVGRKGEIVTGTFHFEADGTAGKQSITNGKFSFFVPNEN